MSPDDRTYVTASYSWESSILKSQNGTNITFTIPTMFYTQIKLYQLIYVRFMDLFRLKSL